MPKITTDSFIERAEKIHGKRYNYEKVDYQVNRIKIIIGCKIHGDFLQSASDHIHSKSVF